MLTLLNISAVSCTSLFTGHTSTSQQLDSSCQVKRMGLSTESTSNQTYQYQAPSTTKGNVQYIGSSEPLVDVYLDEPHSQNQNLEIINDLGSVACYRGDPWCRYWESTSDISSYDVHGAAGYQLHSQSYQINRTNSSDINSTMATCQIGSQLSLDWAETNRPIIGSEAGPATKYEKDRPQLQRWAYEINRNDLTVAERFEKLKWEVERLERL